MAGEGDELETLEGLGMSSSAKLYRKKYDFGLTNFNLRKTNDCFAQKNIQTNFSWKTKKTHS